MRVSWGWVLLVAACVNRREVLSAAAQVTLSDLQVNVVSDLNPQFRWVLSSSEPTIAHNSYQIFLSRYRAGASDVWTSGGVPSNTSRPITYTGPPLSSHARYFWSVQIETTIGLVAASSEFMTGKLSSSNLCPSRFIERRQAGDALERSFQSASWIWTSEAAPPTAPSADRAFLRTYTPPNGKSASFAEILMAADDRFALYVNGGLAGSTVGVNDEFGWRNAYRYHVFLSSGQSIFAIRGINLPDIHTGADSAAGLLIAIQITHSDGSTAMLTSDSSWRTNKMIPANFQATSFDDSSWVPASVLGKYGVAPWNSEVALPTVIATPNIPPPASPSTSPASQPPFASPSASTITVTSSQTTATTPIGTSEMSMGTTTSGVTSAVGTTLAAFSGSTTNPATTGVVSPGGQDSGSTPKSSPVGAIVGGVVGGLAILALLALITLYRKHLFRWYSSREVEAAVTDKPIPDLLSVQQPFTLMFPEQHVANTYGPSTGHDTGLYPVRKGSSQPNHHQTSFSSGPKYYQDQDGGSSSVVGGVSVAGTGSVVENGGVVPTAALGVPGSRMQRLQDLMGELNRVIAAGGEGSPYVSELRGRISELAREDLVGGSTVIPPPYQSPFFPPGGT